MDFCGVVLFVDGRAFGSGMSAAIDEATRQGASVGEVQATLLVFLAALLFVVSRRMAHELVTLQAMYGLLHDSVRDRQFLIGRQLQTGGAEGAAKRTRVLQRAAGVYVYVVQYCATEATDTYVRHVAPAGARYIGFLSSGCSHGRWASRIYGGFRSRFNANSVDRCASISHAP